MKPQGSCCKSLVLAAVLALAACSSAYRSEPGVAALEQNLLDGSVFGVAAAAAPPAVDLTALDDEMRAFLEERAPLDLSKQQKVRRILRGLLEGGLQLEYHNFHTFTAQETFHSREGNCMSFTNLFIALAREAGLKVSYQEVEVPPSWGSQSGSWLYSKHINALVAMQDYDQVVDFNLDNFDNDYPRYRISDRAALARYHNNMGVHWMGQQDYPGAFLHFRAALQLEPETSFFWTNLGSLYRRAGELPLAEQAYLHAIAIDGEPAAMSNLARHYQQQGDFERARYYEEQVTEFRRHNPFYLYQLARQAYNAADYEEARELLQRAIRFNDQEDRFFQLLGLSHLQLGEVAAAERRFRQAAELADSEDDKARYQRKLDLLAAG
jgi:Flp pilus assembly protein TadD